MPKEFTKSTSRLSKWDTRVLNRNITWFNEAFVQSKFLLIANTDGQLSVHLSQPESAPGSQPCVRLIPMWPAIGASWRTSFLWLSSTTTLLVSFLRRMIILSLYLCWTSTTGTPSFSFKKKLSSTVFYHSIPISCPDSILPAPSLWVVILPLPLAKHLPYRVAAVYFSASNLETWSLIATDRHCSYFSCGSVSFWTAGKNSSILSDREIHRERER